VEQEYFFDCPFCNEHISMVLDMSEGGQSYIEDCQACCRPILIRYECFYAQLESFAAEAS
jgi:hypothetical protein